MGKADIVVIVTGRTLHGVSLAARAKAQRLNLQLAYFNGLGRTSFIRFLVDTVGGEWPDEVAG